MVVFRQGPYDDASWHALILRVVPREEIHGSNRADREGDIG